MLALAITVEGAPIARNAGVVEARADFAIARDIAFGITYGGQFSREETDHRVRGTITMAFDCAINAVCNKS